MAVLQKREKNAQLEGRERGKRVGSSQERDERWQADGMWDACFQKLYSVPLRLLHQIQEAGQLFACFQHALVKQFFV
jgi:hypothetical protein